MKDNDAIFNAVMGLRDDFNRYVLDTERALAEIRGRYDVLMSRYETTEALAQRIATLMVGNGAEGVQAAVRRLDLALKTDKTVRIERWKVVGAILVATVAQLGGLLVAILK